MIINWNFPDLKMPEVHRQVMIKYRYKGRTEENGLPYEVGSAYFYDNEWWVNYHNPITFSKEYEVIGWADYDFSR